MATVYACDTCNHVFKTVGSLARHQSRQAVRGSHRGYHAVEHVLKKDVDYLNNFRLGVEGF